MSGVKGLSGRKTTRDEEKRLRIIEKSWDAIEAYLDSEGGTLKDKADMGARVATKDQPTKLEGGLSFNQMPTAIVDNKPLEVNVGTNPA